MTGADITQPGERIVGRISVYRVLGEDGGMRDEIRTDDGMGDELDLPTAVGMLAIAQHMMLCDEGEFDR